MISTAAEASIRSSVAEFESIGEQFLVLESLGMLAGVAEARGDLEGAATTYEQLLEGARASGLANLVPVWLIRLGALRARQEDDVTAAQLFAEAVARSDRADMRGTALIGLAGATRRLGDVESAYRMLEQAAAEYASVDHEDGRGGCAHRVVLVGDRRRRPRPSGQLRRSGVPGAVARRPLDPDVGGDRGGCGRRRRIRFQG